MTAAEQLPGMPAEPPKPPNAGDLVAAWCAGWAEAHDGHQPHPSVLRRVAGICRTVGKDCATVDEWRDAWRAAKDTGRAGRYDIVGTLAEPARPSYGRQNHYLGIVREASTADALAAALIPRKLRA